MAGPGLTFAPMEGDAADRQATSAQLSPQQRAVQVLSMRLPRVLGARSVTPRELMGAAGTAGPSSMAGGFSPESAVLQTLLTNAGVGQGGIDPSMFTGATAPPVIPPATPAPTTPSLPPSLPPATPPSTPPRAPAPPPAPPTFPPTPMFEVENPPAQRQDPFKNRIPTQDGFMDNPNAFGSGNTVTSGALPPSAQPPIQEAPARPEFPGANKPGVHAAQDVAQIISSLMRDMGGMR